MSSGTSTQYILSEDYNTMPDEQVVKWANEGNECAQEHLIRKYKICKSKSKILFSCWS